MVLIALVHFTYFQSFIYTYIIIQSFLFTLLSPFLRVYNRCFSTLYLLNYQCFHSSQVFPIYKARPSPAASSCAFIICIPHHKNFPSFLKTLNGFICVFPFRLDLFRSFLLKSHLQGNTPTKVFCINPFLHFTYSMLVSFYPYISLTHPFIHHNRTSFFISCSNMAI